MQIHLKACFLIKQQNYQNLKIFNLLETEKNFSYLYKFLCIIFARLYGFYQIYDEMKLVQIWLLVLLLFLLESFSIFLHSFFHIKILVSFFQLIIHQYNYQFKISYHYSNFEILLNFNFKHLKTIRNSIFLYFDNMKLQIFFQAF